MMAVLAKGAGRAGRESRQRCQCRTGAPLASRRPLTRRPWRCHGA